jgi:hypothetical protein
MRLFNYLVLFLLLVSSCASTPRYLANTKVTDTSENREVLKAMERYRMAMEKQDATKLLLMASERYWDDNGTPSAADDFGPKGLRERLTQKFDRVDDIRYSLRYKTIKNRKSRVFVVAHIDASYTVTDNNEPQRKDYRDENQFVLERDGDEWKFLSGM